ncbi:MAG: aminoacyl-tRNA hydrolase [Saprospiraceae bacterium]|nr:aminoacyl-tRNA hydrolase [Saprospiraceae bacterium]MBK7809885.1 aminoacyl-tRNA hydrolase [Saprospiraceae bacterium]
MKYLICGLGNMHIDYMGTRHNIGFEVADALAQKHRGQWSPDTHCHKTTIKIKNKTLIIIKPTTFMNLSGKAVRYWMQKEKVELNHILVVTDDLNIDFGTIRLKPGGSDGGHNGLKDIQTMLGSVQYPRLRIGIGADFSKGRQVNYVLSKWTDQESKWIPEILEASVKAIETFSLEGISSGMNKYNSFKISNP